MRSIVRNDESLLEIQIKQVRLPEHLQTRELNW